MAQKQMLFTSSEKQDVQRAAEFLRQLADKLAHRNITLKQGSETARLEIPERVNLSVRAAKKTGKKQTKQTLNIQISWIEGDQVAPGIEVK